MARKGSYYLFKPPFSDSEYFVKVTDVKMNQQDQNRYVYYEHLLNDMEGSYEQSYFNQGSQELTADKISTMITNMGKEIENLKEDMSEFNKVLKKIKKDEGKINKETNGKGTINEDDSVKERNIERVERE